MYEDMQEFVLGNGKKPSYLTKFLRKIKWVDQEARILINELCHEHKIFPNGTWNVTSVLITTYPTFATEVMEEVRCIPLPLLLDEYDKHIAWPIKANIEIELH